MIIYKIYYKGQFISIMECDKKLYKGYNYIGLDIIFGKYGTYEYDYYGKNNQVRFIVTNIKENDLFIEKYNDFLDNWLRIEKRKITKQK